MNPEAENFLFRYKRGTAKTMTHYRILKLFSYIGNYDERIIHRSKNIAYLLLDLPNELFAYITTEYYYELLPFFDIDAIKKRIEAMRKTERSRSLRNFLDKKKYVYQVSDIGANVLVLSIEKGSLKYNATEDLLLVLKNGVIQAIEIPSCTNFDESVNTSYIREGKKQLEKDLKEYEIHNKLRLEFVK